MPHPTRIWITGSWTAKNLPLSISQTSGSESYSYDADGERVKKVAGSVTTVYLEGLWEEVVGGTPKAYYRFNGQTAVLYTYSPSAFTYLTNDHLGSVSVATNQAQAVAGTGAGTDVETSAVPTTEPRGEPMC